MRKSHDSFIVFSDVAGCSYIRKEFCSLQLGAYSKLILANKLILKSRHENAHSGLPSRYNFFIIIYRKYLPLGIKSIHAVDDI